MLGGIAGDVVGSVYEHAGLKSKRFPLFGPSSTFTDDTVLTVAVAESLLTGAELAATFKDWYRRYPWAGYGGSFQQWAREPNHTGPYNSWGNGSAMRVGPVGWACDELEETLALAAATAEVTHNHPQGIVGAQATAGAIFLSRTGSTKAQIQAFLETRFGYALHRSLDEIRPTYSFDVSCQGSVPEALAAFLQSTDFEDALRNAVSLGGDADTQACIAGSVAEAFYGGVPPGIEADVVSRLGDDLRDVVGRFRARYGQPRKP